MTNEHLQDALYRLSEARRQLEKAESADHAGAHHAAGVEAEKAWAQTVLCKQAIRSAIEDYEKQAAKKRGEPIAV